MDVTGRVKDGGLFFCLPLFDTVDEELVIREGHSPLRLPQGHLQYGGGGDVMIAAEKWCQEESVKIEERGGRWLWFILVENWSGFAFRTMTSGAEGVGGCC